MLGCAEAYRKSVYGKNRAVNTNTMICKRQLKPRSRCTENTNVTFPCRWHCISLSTGMPSPEVVVWQSPKCGGLVSHLSKWRLSDAVGWLQASKMLCSTCSLTTSYFRTKEQVDYVLKATWSKEFRKSLLNNFSQCFYQTVLCQILPFSLNSLSHSISLLLFKSVHKQKIKSFPKEMTTLTHYLV